MKPSDYDELLNTLEPLVDEDNYKLLKDYTKKLKNIEVEKIAYKIRNHIIEAPFTAVAAMCKHSEFGIDKMTYATGYTCRHQAVVPPGDSWVDCRLETCPMLKKYCTQSKE